MVRIDGLVERPCELAFGDLAALPDQIDDVAELVAGRQGAAVRLTAILRHSGALPEATYLTVASAKGDFCASVPLAAVGNALLVYRLGDEPLPSAKGGPVRLLIPDAAVCHTAEVDTCANVKFVARLTLEAEPGKDTRPTSPRTHRALHEKPGHEHTD